MTTNTEQLEAFLRVKVLEQYCASDLLSLEGLRQHIDEIKALPTPNHDLILQRSSFLHLACKNNHISLEMVELLLSWYPDAAKSQSRLFHEKYQFDPGEVAATTAFPLHLACLNSQCPSSVIEMLLDECSAAIRHACMFDGVCYCVASTEDAHFEGLPIHFYLSRSSEIHIPTVKMLVDANSESLLNADRFWSGTPLHIFLANKEYRADKYSIVQYIINTEPATLRMANDYDELPIHTACMSSHTNAHVLQLLLSAWPESISQENDLKALPIHNICSNSGFNNVDFLRYLITEYPDSVRQSDDCDSRLPIHLAALHNKPAYCRMLLEAYPESLTVDAGDGTPIHLACSDGCLEAIKSLYEFNPEVIHLRSNRGRLPIHTACIREELEIVEYLVSKSTLALQLTTAESPCMIFHYVCCSFPDDNTVKAVKLLFDAYPEAIRISAPRHHGSTPLVAARNTLAYYNIHPNPDPWSDDTASNVVVSFLETQQAYADMAENIGLMTTLDDLGWLPLHHALHENASLGAIKLMLKSTPFALQVATRREAYPLHISCEFSTPGVVQYLIKIGAGRSLTHCDVNGDSPLHYACRGGNCAIVKYLLGRSGESGTKRNNAGKLPVHLLCERGEDDTDLESLEHVETIWRLLLAYPETVMG